MRLQAHNVKSKVIQVFNTSFYNAAPGVRSTPGIMGITAICPPGFKEPRHVHRIIAEEMLKLNQGVPNVYDAYTQSYFTLRGDQLTEEMDSRGIPKAISWTTVRR